jgi:phosphoribosylaminoimidazolecarboxamide formyltransferase/IMP cyclohydrolase
LLSVSDKTGLTEFAAGLRELGVELLASGGTAALLGEHGVEVREIAEWTGSPELLGGRVKTLHPNIHAGILAKRDDPNQLRELRQHGIEPIDLVVVNLYPFAERVTAETPADEAMEWVDIGGETLIRAAAKNHQSVGVTVDPDEYSAVLAELRSSGGLSEETSRRLARKAFEHVTRYNALIARWFSRHGKEPLPEILALVEPRQLVLRYGENPHQQGALYGPAPPEQLQGKPLSYVNILDADAALKCAFDFERPTAVIVKHATACGVASAEALAEAFKRALAADEKSAFGGIVGLNRPLDAETAERIGERFFEVVVAPEITAEAREALARKRNLRVLRAPDALYNNPDVRTTAFGTLAQTPSFRTLTERDLEIVTERKPTAEEMRDLLFSWNVVKHVKSNAIVLAKDERTVGIGSGQVSRVDAVEIAVRKAGERASGSVLASDAFFPFQDGVDLAAEAGVTAIIQPGGSVRDEEVIAAANEHGMAMVFTHVREFRH